MSSEQEEERKDYVEREEPVETTPVTPAQAAQSPPATTVRETVVKQPSIVPGAPVSSTSPPGSERRESVVTRRNTNTGAIVAMIVGIVILLLGLYLVFTRVFPYLSYPWSLVAVLIVAIVLIIVGASLLQTRNRL
jgi:hypothetical protein